MSITGKIINSIVEPTKSFLYKGAPVFAIKAVFEFLPFIRIAQLLAGRGKCQPSRVVVFIQYGQVFPFEFIPEDMYGNKKGAI